MNFPRSTLAIILYEWIKERERIEKSWGYTMDSGILAAARETLQRIRAGEGLDLYGDSI